MYLRRIWTCAIPAALRLTGGLACAPDPPNRFVNNPPSGCKKNSFQFATELTYSLPWDHA